jgi:hypothetical protein
MAKQESSVRPNHGLRSDAVPGSRTRENPAGDIVVRRPPDQASEIKPGTRRPVTVTDAKLTPSDLTRMAAPTRKA